MGNYRKAAEEGNFFLRRVQLFFIMRKHGAGVSNTSCAQQHHVLLCVRFARCDDLRRRAGSTGGDD